MDSRIKNLCKQKYTKRSIAVKKLKVEISDLADQANGSVLVRYGETAVFATAVMAKNKKEGMNFFPLTVDYEEKFYAAGRIMGGRFMKRRADRPKKRSLRQE